MGRVSSKESGCLQGSASEGWVEQGLRTPNRPALDPSAVSTPTEMRTQAFKSEYAGIRPRVKHGESPGLNPVSSRDAGRHRKQTQGPEGG